MEIYARDENETRQVGERLARSLRHGGMIFLYGDSGSGKSTLVRGILSGLGIMATKGHMGASYIKSYEVGGTGVCHIDLYSLVNVDDPHFPKVLSHLQQAQMIRLVESPQRVQDALPQPDMSIHFRYGLKGRALHVDCHTALGRRFSNNLPGRH